MTTATAVILAAGMGSRLKPLTDDRPKALVEIGGETILGRALRLLREHGVKRVVIATGYRADAVERALQNSSLAVTYCPNPDFEHTQNAVSLALCREALGGESFFKLDGDVLFQPEVLERLEDSSAELAVAVDGKKELDAEAMKVRAHLGRIAAFGKGLSLESSSAETIGIELVRAGASDILFAALGAMVSAKQTSLYYEDVYSELVGRGALTAAAVEVGDLPWTEVDNAEDLARARSLFSAA